MNLHYFITLQNMSNYPDNVGKIEFEVGIMK